MTAVRGTELRALSAQRQCGVWLRSGTHAHSRGSTPRHVIATKECEGGRDASASAVVENYRAPPKTTGHRTEAEITPSPRHLRSACSTCQKPPRLLVNRSNLWGCRLHTQTQPQIGRKSRHRANESFDFCCTLLPSSISSCACQVFLSFLTKSPGPCRPRELEQELMHGP